MEDYEKLFKNFFEKGMVSSTYKYVFLSTLLDLCKHIKFESYNDKPESHNDEWIKKDGDFIKVQLDFFAVRFIKYYWEIQSLQIRHIAKDTGFPNKNDDVNIVGLIENQNITKADSKILSQKKFKDFRNTVIKKSIKPEVFKKLSNDFKGKLYEPQSKHIVIKTDALDFMCSNLNWIKKELDKKVIVHLRKYNQTYSGGIVRLIDENNPFFEYVESLRKNVFLLGLNAHSLERDFENTVLKEINLKNHPEIQDPVSVWGLPSTKDNKRIWNKIKKGDIVLFCKNNICFAKTIVRDVFQNRKEGARLWMKSSGVSVRELLIIFEKIYPIEIDLQNTRIKLIEPTVPNAYNFPITQMDVKTQNMMRNMYGGIEPALDNISRLDSTPDIQNVTVTFQYSLTKIRIGQEKFRKEILKNYYNICAVCDISDEKLLEASHILPVRYSETAGDVTNGICLCVLHHKMIDQNYMYFNKLYQLKFLPKTSDYLKKTCTKKQIEKTQCHIMPSQEYLERSMIALKENN